MTPNTEFERSLLNRDVTTLADDTRSEIKEVMDAAQNPFCWVSGGKESLAMADILRPWKDRVQLLHVELDDAFPDVTENLVRVVSKLGYAKPIMIIRPGLSMPEYLDKFGWPSEIVPTSLQGMGGAGTSPFVEAGPRMESWVHCQQVRWVQPLLNTCSEQQADVILVGTKASDSPLFKAMGSVLDATSLVGWIRLNPMQFWSDRDVYSYLYMRSIPLPAIYSKWKIDADFECVDCMGCTWQPKHWVMMRDHYTQEFEERWPAVEKTYRAQLEQIDRYRVRLTDVLAELSGHHEPLRVYEATPMQLIGELWRRLRRA